MRGVTFRLYINNGNNLSSATLIGAITATSNNSQTLTFNAGFTTLSAGSTWYYLITADVPFSGLNGDYISLTTTSFFQL